MKNTLKRILLLLPVISVLLVALAVPTFADYSQETGWSEPIGVIDGPLEISVSTAGVSSTYDFVGYKVVVDIDTLVSNRELYNNSSGYCFVYLGPDYGYEQISYLMVRDGTFTVRHYGSSDNISVNYTELVLYIEDYPTELLNLANTAWRYVDFEVYEVVTPSLTEPIGNVWTEIMIWITSAINSVMGAFYVDGSLTLLGTLAVIGVSVGIGFLLIGLIQRFLHLRG